jgi:hypothetical protein
MMGYYVIIEDSSGFAIEGCSSIAAAEAWIVKYGDKNKSYHWEEC